MTLIASQPFTRTVSGTGSGLLALSRNSTVMKIRSVVADVLEVVHLVVARLVGLVAGLAGRVGVLDRGAVVDMGAGACRRSSTDQK